MKKMLLAFIILMFAVPQAVAHPGRTDKNGGHNCSAKSKQKGLCTGYHYHKKKDYLEDTDSNALEVPVLTHDEGDEDDDNR